MSILTEEQIVAAFITDQNHDLWDDLRSHYTIKVSDEFSVYQLEYSSLGSVRILTDKNYSPALFTHELLHLEIRKLGLSTLEYFETLSNDFIKAACIGILNCIEHVLFFDDFIDMGFNKHEFTMDYHTSVIDVEQLEELIKQSKQFDKSIQVLMFYSIYWTVKNEEYIGHDREDALRLLRSLSPILFSKCNSMYDSIIDLDLQNPNVQSNFHQIMSNHLRRNY